MSMNSKIEWCEATVNFWHGCTKVSPGCANCYAAAHDRRLLLDTKPHWGHGVPRLDKRDTARDLAIKLNRKAWREGRRIRVFANSMNDWLDPEVPEAWLSDMLWTIGATPHLDWLLLTKRPEYWRCRMLIVSGLDDAGAMVANGWLNGRTPPNLWIGTTAEDQARANARIPKLLEIPARVRFLSCEPLLGKLDLTSLTIPCKKGEHVFDCLQCDVDPDDDAPWHGATIDWVISGGESGPKARAPHPEWFRSLRDQCKLAGVPFFFKQWGEWAPNCLHGRINDPPCRTTPRPTPGLPGVMFRCGKRRAGRVLFGNTYIEFPIPERIRMKK